MGNGEVLTRTACLVRYGRLGWVALFSATDGLNAEHGDSVVIQTERGLNWGSCCQMWRSTMSAMSVPRGMCCDWPVERI